MITSGSKIYSLRGLFAIVIMAYFLLVEGCSGYAPISEHGSNAGLTDDIAAAGAERDVRSEVLRTAQAMLGVPYRYGGISPSGFDCSGLVFYSYARAGIQVPRTTLTQYQHTKPLSVRELLPGDVLFFRLNGRDISHVGIYQGNNKFIHAPVSGKRVSIDSLNARFWGARFVRGGRFI